MPTIRAVFFDIGGVVVRSPLLAINAYEAEKNLPRDYLNVIITNLGHDGSWQRFERGEMEIRSFYQAFGRELSDLESGKKWYQGYCASKGMACPPLPAHLHIDGRELFGRMMRESASYDPLIVEAIRCLRASGKYRVVALTNNFSGPFSSLDQSELDFLGRSDGPVPCSMVEMFDDFVDSSSVGMRKPEPGFYLHGCARNGVRPDEVVFLDDLGMNLKAASKLGMHTIHVPIGGSEGALRKLEAILGLSLIGEELNSSTEKSKL
ncbi:hypothetical protein BOTBODRAFT_31029 [Botryobasidium botryosum FD-172 SS1]|uniref:HAD-like protein n=1 Tax=Botryobasidium botryosum (strain FD-172 SS1) TaxID=930990 RepID=A0A067MNS4_BOTB1|nr:hypothetical protein BOTBODRAFT_31029 [Botryobasidium botryosum FD-172 SS1]